MTTQRKVRVPDSREHALEDRAEARRLESQASRAQSEAYAALAEACSQRAQALRVVSLADHAVARLGGSEYERSWAWHDGERAGTHAELMDRESSLHEAQSRRALAEADRAEAEAQVSSQKAHLAPLESPAGRLPRGKGA
ncbi:hypothetical protein JYJ95_26825 [Corallococcus exiguus]|uniref:hypothetical protein n=1 Tax=Corallococcus exiguus TaxID=83462 RepID=UPI001A8EBB55|nr:hypothetical protein [Corallococcus exiguus]MBN8470140.1 hypothetical protein [Corallococcus exiguus]